MNTPASTDYNRSTQAPTCSFGGLCALPGKLSRWLDQNAYGFAPIFPRLLLAYEFGEAGFEKYNGENWFADLSFPFPFNLLPADFNWTMATTLEIIAPVALILGLATRFFSLALLVLTVVAIAAVHWPSNGAPWPNYGKAIVFPTRVMEITNCLYGIYFC